MTDANIEASLGNVQVGEQPWRQEAQQLGLVGAKALQSGAGRAGRISAALSLLLPEDRRLVLAALDEATRPMNDREIEKALMVTDLSMKDRKRLVAALRPYQIIMVLPR